MQLKDISTTPYSARAIVLAEEKWSKAPESFHNDENDIPNQNDRENVASTSNNNPEVCWPAFFLFLIDISVVTLLSYQKLIHIYLFCLLKLIGYEDSL